MKRLAFSLFLLMFVLVGVMGVTPSAAFVPIKTPGPGGGGNPGYFKYTEQINLTQTTTETTSTSYPGEDLDSLSLCTSLLLVEMMGLKDLLRSSWYLSLSIYLYRLFTYRIFSMIV
jgi:hypothetical protein